MERLQISAKGSSSSSSCIGLEKYCDLRKSCGSSASSRALYRETGSSLSPRSRLVRAVKRHESGAPNYKLRHRHANKEIVRRALTPPVKRLNWRWYNFQPTPSRLSMDQKRKMKRTKPVAGMCSRCGGGASVADMKTDTRFCYIPFYSKSWKAIVCTFCGTTLKSYH
ncbi:hypothetical protein LguiB_030094 [Lonicera macranthoides]